MIRPHVSVAQPCPESWEKMQPDSCGKFCNSCQKKVYDFRNSSLSEFTAIKSELGDSLCGNFNADEEGRIYFKPKSTVLSGTKIFLCAFLLCFNSWIFAGNNTPVHQYLDRVRSEMISQHGQSKDIYIKVTRHRKALKNARVEMTIDGKTFQGETDEHGRCVISIPADMYIEQVVFDVEGGGIRTIDAYCKSAELSTRNIKLKFSPRKNKHTMGFIGCPSF